MARHRHKAKGKAHPSPAAPKPAAPSGRPRPPVRFLWAGLVAGGLLVVAAMIWNNRAPDGDRPSDPPSITTGTAAPPGATPAATRSDAPDWDADLSRLPPFASLDDAATSPSRIASALRQEAIAIADLLIRKFPQEPEPYFLMGTLQRLRGQSESAIRYWNQGLAMNPEHVDAFDGLAFLALERGEYERAINFWERALQLAPRLPGAHNGIGRAYMALGKAEASIAAFEKEIEIVPHDSLSHYLLGQQYFQIREFDKARRQYETAISLDPNMTNAYYGLSMALARMGRREESREHLQKFQELKDIDFAALEQRDRQYDDLKQTREYAAKAHAEAGRLYFLRDGKRLAETVWMRAAELDPKQTTCREFLSLIYDQAGDFDSSIFYLRQLCELDPTNLDYALTLAASLYDSGAHREGELQYSRIMEMAPDDIRPMREQARRWLTSGRNLPYALSLAQMTLEMEPSARNYYLLGWACERNGDLANALTAIEKATQLDPANTEYRRIHQRLIAQKQD